MASGDVFVSYASQDAPIANAITEALEKNGITCWIAPRDVSPGEFYADAIVRALNESRVLLLVLTDSAVTSPHVLREVERTSAKRHAIVSLRLTTSPLPPALEYFLSASHWLDVSLSGIDTAMPKLIEAVKRLIAPASGAAPKRAGDTANSPVNLFPRPPDSKSALGLSRPLLAVMTLIAVVATYLVVEKPWLSKRVAVARTAAPEIPAAAALIPEKSVAVLPFVDMSEKHDQEYFSDGLSEELIDMLTKVPDLRVPARTSSFYFKGKQTTIKDIAAALGVAHVLEGSVRKSGKILRVTVQLIRVDNGYHLWSETFDRKLDDIFKIQDEIARAVMTALQSSLQPNALPQGVGTTDSAAYTLYLQARKINQLATTRAEWDSALQLLREAVARDPRFVDGWAWIAFVQSNKAVFNLGDDKGIAEMRQASAHAILLNPNSANAHTIAADILWDVDWDWVGAEAEFRRAYELEPSASANATQLASTMLILGRDPKTFREMYNKAIARDPSSWFVFYVRSIFRSALGELAGAEVDARKALELNASGAELHGWLAFVLLLQHKYEDALVEVRKERDDTARRQGLAETYYALGRKADADVALRESEKLDAKNGAVGIAENYAYRGNLDQAFSWLERAYRQRDQGLPGINHDPLMKNLYGDPRWPVFLGKMKLPELSRTDYPGVYRRIAPRS